MANLDNLDTSYQIIVILDHLNQIGQQEREFRNRSFKVHTRFLEIEHALCSLEIKMVGYNFFLFLTSVMYFVSHIQ